jgi:hypothetical protein
MYSKSEQKKRKKEKKGKWKMENGTAELQERYCLFVIISSVGY